MELLVKSLARSINLGRYMKCIFSLVIIFFSIGCTQTQVYHKEYSILKKQVLSELHIKDHSKNNTFYYDLNNLVEHPLSALSLPLSKYEFTLLESNESKLEFKLQHTFFPKSNEYYCIERISDSKSRLSVDFFEYFLLSFSPCRFHERAFLDKFRVTSNKHVRGTTRQVPGL